MLSVSDYYLHKNVQTLAQTIQQHKQKKEVFLHVFPTSLLYCHDAEKTSTAILSKVSHFFQFFQLTYPTEQVVFHTLSSFNELTEHALSARQKRISHNMFQLNAIWETIEEQTNTQKENPKLFSLEEEIEYRKIISLFSITRHYWKILTIMDNTLIWHPYIQALFQTLSPPKPVIDKTNIRLLKIERAWVQIEALLEQNIPLQSLSKINGNRLTVSDKKILKSWIQKINENKNQISFQIFRKTLKEIIRVIHLHGFLSLKLSSILYWLYQNECILITETDYAHMNWRQSLRAGSVVQFTKSKKTTLGDPLGKEKTVNLYRIFTLPEYPECVMKIANNCFRLFVDQRQAKDENLHWGIPLVKTVVSFTDPFIPGIDPKGRFLIIERLSPAFTFWKSTSYLLDDADIECASAFSNYLHHQIDFNTTIENLSCPHLMWNKEGNLVSTRLLRKGEFNFNTMEEQCEQAASGNPYLLRFFVYVSRLHKHPIARYYSILVKNTLQSWANDPTVKTASILAHPLPLYHNHTHYIEHLKTFTSALLVTCNESFEEIQNRYYAQGRFTPDVVTTIRITIKNRCVDFYQNSPLHGKLCITQLKAYILSEATLPLIDLQMLKEYYQEKNNLIKEGNSLPCNIQQSPIKEWVHSGLAKIKSCAKGIFSASSC